MGEVDKRMKTETISTGKAAAFYAFRAVSLSVPVEIREGLRGGLRGSG